MKTTIINVIVSLHTSIILAYLVEDINLKWWFLFLAGFLLVFLIYLEIREIKKEKTFKVTMTKNGDVSFDTPEAFDLFTKTFTTKNKS